MRTTLLLKQHEKCSCILEMIQKADKRIESYRDSMIAARWLKSYYLEKMEYAIAVRYRLYAYYATSLKKIVEPVLNKIA